MKTTAIQQKQKLKGKRPQPATTRSSINGSDFSPSPPFFHNEIQTKLKTGKPGDKYERQADAVADRVVNGHPAPNRIIKPPTSPDTQDLQKEEIQTSQNPDSQPQEDLEEATVQSQLLEKNRIVETTLPEGALQARMEEENSSENLEELSADRQVQGQLEEKPRPLETQKDEGDTHCIQSKEDPAEHLPPSQDEEAQLQNDDEVQSQEEESLAAQSALAIEGETLASVETLFDAARGKGKPLPENTRESMENSFSADFSGIKIHTDDPAVQITQALNAQAVTQGKDIYFNKNRFMPETRKGQHLLAHELTHTLQQGASLQSRLSPIANSSVIQKKEEDSDTYLVRPEILNAIKLARREIGKVNAKVTGADGTRMGWERLYEYFFTAFGNKEVIHKDVIKYINKKYPMPSWCGIFVWWALKKSGLPIVDWAIGLNILETMRVLPPGELPKKGYIAYRNSFQHFAMVTGVESPESAAGKPVQTVKIATINGNTSGDDNLGGQIEEKWESKSRWNAFFDPLAKLNLPEVPLVQTGYEPEPVDVEPEPPETTPEETAEETAGETAPPVTEDIGEPAIEAEAPPPGESQVPVEMPKAPAPVEAEPAAEVAGLEFAGSSDQSIVELTDASPSVMAKSYPDLGGAVTEKLGTEQNEEAANAPVLEAKSTGEVEGNPIPMEPVSLPASDINDGVTEADPSPLTPTPHEDKGPVPSNKENEREVDRQDDSSFGDWLKQKLTSFMSAIKTRDPGVNTQAGPAPKVQLEGTADPNNMQTQKQDSADQVKAQRDKTSEQLMNHPGQKNIKPKKVEKKQAVTLSTENPPPITTPEDPGMADYANASLPENIRNRADQMLQPGIAANTAQVKNQTVEAAQTKESDKQSAIEETQAKAKEANQKADTDQRNIVIENRKKVAAQQKAGIEDTYKKTNEFNKQSNDKQQENQRLIKDKTDTAQEQAKGELEKGEKDAEAEKKKKEAEAAAKKRELEKEQEKSSWWEKAGSFLKKAVKVITSAIDGIFNALRAAVATIIEKAKNAAIGLINKARDWIVNKINDFRDWAKKQVNKYLAETFPGLAAKINSAIDAVADVAVAGVNAVADTLIAGIEALAKELSEALDKILASFQAGLKAAVQIAGAVLTGDFVEALRIAIRAGCEIAGIDPQPVFDFFDRAGKLVLKILKEPGQFINNVMLAVGGGVTNFGKNIKKHLISGFIGWLTGALSEVPITLPEKWDLKGIFSLVAQILGLTYENIKARIIKRYPPAEKAFHLIEKGFELFQRLRKNWPASLWDEIKNALSNFKEMILGPIKSFAITTVIKESIVWLISLLNPASALAKALKLIFDVVMFLIERFQQIKDFVVSVYSSIAAIAAGQLAGAKAAVENAMARSLPVVIGFLASMVGLGGIGKTVTNIIKKVSAPVNKLLDKIIDKAVTFVKKLIKGGKAAVGKVKEKLVQWWKAKKSFTMDNGEKHTLAFKGSGKSAKLVIRSSEKIFDAYISSISEEILKDKEKKAAYKKAKKINTAIQKLTSDPIKGKTDAKKKAASKKRKDEFQKLLNELSLQVSKIAGPEIPEWGEYKTHGKNAAGFGVRMDIGILSIKGKGITQGSTPRDTSAKLYENSLNLRRFPGGSNFYVKGHLLNHNLGGPGKWDNMTPLSVQGNKNHLQGIESELKTKVGKGSIFSYSVTPQYPGGARGDKEALKSKVTEDVAEDQKTDFKNIIDAEDYVPHGLEIIVKELEPKGKEFTAKDSRNFSIPNPIKRSPVDYHLAGSPKIEWRDLVVNEVLNSPPDPKFLKDSVKIHVDDIKKAKASTTDNFLKYEDLAERVMDTKGISKDDPGRKTMVTHKADIYRQNKFIRLSPKKIM